MTNVPTFRPLVEWRCEDERRAGVPLWMETGEQEQMGKLADLKAEMERVRAELVEEREQLVKRIAEIDAELGDPAPAASAKRKRGRPAKAGE